jgi:FkbM family methyltransferase
LPRYKQGTTNILGNALKFVDSASFCFIYDEVFKKEIYNFKTKNKKPYIIDAGANIGLSTLYFKKLYPSAEIVAFEPDLNVFKILKFNMESFGLEFVSIINKALWNNVTKLKFLREGADGGRIAIAGDDNLVELTTIRLQEFLYRKVDLLKIDIEGAEITVLEDCKDLLGNVDRIFVEYHSFSKTPQSLDKLLNILFNAGFRYNIQHVGVFSNNPFIKINEYHNMDLQLNIFAYRL